MYLPFTTLLVFTSTLKNLPSESAGYTASGNTVAKSVAYRQAVAPPPSTNDAASSSLRITSSTSVDKESKTSIVVSTSSLTYSQTSSQAQIPSAPQSSSATSTLVISTSAWTLPTTQIQSTKSLTTALSTITTTVSTALPTTSDSSSSITPSNPTPTAQPASDSTIWKNKGILAGIIIGSVVGLLVLGVLIYSLLACARGVNVFDCCGGFGRKGNEEKPRSRLPSRSSDTYPFSDNLEAGYSRPIRPNSYGAGPLPVRLPQQVAENHRAEHIYRDPSSAPTY